MIQKSLVEEIQEAKYFTILADEAASRNQEQIALCIRLLIKIKTLEKSLSSLKP